MQQQSVPVTSAPGHERDYSGLWYGCTTGSATAVIRVSY